jgi:hypothetical protein
VQEDRRDMTKRNTINVKNADGYRAQGGEESQWSDGAGGSPIDGLIGSMATSVALVVVEAQSTLL